MIKKVTFLLIASLFIISCRYDRVYHNRTFRYKVKYPNGWVAVNSGHNRSAEEKFKERLKQESALISYSSVDVAFYDPSSESPVFDMISFRADQTRFEVEDLKSYLPTLIDLFTYQLSIKFSNVTNLSSDMYSFKNGKIFRFDFSFTYKNRDYLSYYYIIPGRLFATYFVNGICKMEKKDSFFPILQEVLNSFKKY